MLRQSTSNHHILLAMGSSNGFANMTVRRKTIFTITTRSGLPRSKRLWKIVVNGAKIRSHNRSFWPGFFDYPKINNGCARHVCGLGIKPLDDARNPKNG